MTNSEYDPTKISVDSPTYTTSDFNLAVVLSMKFRLREVRREGRRGIFAFDNSPELSEFVEQYWNQDLSVEPVAHAQAQKSLKNRLYSRLVEDE